MTDALIDIKDVHHAYATDAGPLPVLNGLNVSVQEGGFVAVVIATGGVFIRQRQKGEVTLHIRTAWQQRRSFGRGVWRSTNCRCPIANAA